MGYIVNWEKLKAKNALFWPNKALCRISDLRPKREKMRDEKWVCKPNKALHLKGI